MFSGILQELYLQVHLVTTQFVFGRLVHGDGFMFSRIIPVQSTPSVGTQLERYLQVDPMMRDFEWDTVTWKCLHVLQGHTGSIYLVEWNPRGTSLVSAFTNETIRLWN